MLEKLSWLGVAIAVLGCSGHPKRETSLNPVTDDAGRDGVEPSESGSVHGAIPSYLGDGYLTQVRKRAWVKRCGDFGFSPTTIESADECWDEHILGEVAVVEERGEYVRVVSETADVRAAIYLRAADLDERVAARTALRGRADDAQDPLPVTLLAGAPIKTLEQEGDWRRVEVVDNGVTVSGWLPSAALARVYAALTTAALVDTLAVNSAVDVIDRPGGSVIAELAPGDVHVRGLRRLGESSAGLVEIEVLTRWLEVRGFVVATAVTDHPAESFGGLVGRSGWGSSGTTWLRASRGIAISLEPDQEVIAVTTAAPTRLALSGERRERWVEVRFMTGWGMAVGWLLCPAYRQLEAGVFGCGEVESSGGDEG